MKNVKDSHIRDSRFEIRIAGSGGQGIILAGIILAEAATLDGKYAAQSQNYGPEARGGSSISEVVLSELEIDYPWSLEADILVALSQEAYDRNVPCVKDEGLIIADSDMVNRILWKKTIRLPFREIARGIGEERAINIAALGAVAAFCPCISRDSIAKAITKRLPSSKVELSIQAFNKTVELAKNTDINDWDKKEECEI